jgi:AAA+ superfamily predicted ATPase
MGDGRLIPNDDDPRTALRKVAKSRWSRRSRAGTQERLQALPDIVKLWLLKILFALGAERQCFRDSSLRVSALIDVFSLQDMVDADGDADVARITRHLRAQYLRLARTPPGFPVDSNLAQNVSRLAELVGLTDTDCRILELTVTLKLEIVLEETADLLGGMSSMALADRLAVLLDIPASEIRERLSPQGLLAQTGLVCVDRNSSGTLSYKLDLLSPTFADNMLTLNTDPVSLLRYMVIPSTGPELDLTDYGHVSDDLKIVRPLLREARESGRPGVNVLIYGPPGTGKSELVRVLARDLGCELFEIASEDADGDPIDPNQRLKAFRAAQSFFSQRKALLFFDEIEDIFDDASLLFPQKNTGKGRKAWINRALESNHVPALWVSNSTICVDNAFIRRFDMVIELPIPPKAQRSKIISTAVGDLLDAAAIERFVESEVLAPAVLTRAASVVHRIRDKLPPGEAGASLERLVNSTLEAQSHPLIRAAGKEMLPDTYDLAFVRADKDLAEVAQGIGTAKSARICLYGPPGTGKTAFGYFLAQHLEMPLLVRRASDILSKWVGEAEKNIARAFRQAADDGAILLIEEVDSFLHDRRGVARGWEATAVNEMLTQMEAFEGVFVASTNLLDGFDQAALRRFDLKLKFDYLCADQAWMLLHRQALALGLPEPFAETRARVDRIRTLTPGDYAAVVRRHRFHPIHSVEGFVTALEEECALKEDRAQMMGFV